MISPHGKKFLCFQNSAWEGCAARLTVKKEGQMNILRRLDQRTRRVWAILHISVKNFLRIDGAQWAGAFAFHAFFSLFPLMVLLVTIASFFVDRDRAGQEIIAYMERYVPISGVMQHRIYDVIAGVIKARRHASAIALLVLIWGALRSFTTLIKATNRAWDATVYMWWRTRMKSLALLGITAGAFLLGLTVPVLANVVKAWLFTAGASPSRIYALGSFVIPWLVVFLSLSIFYRLAPRTPTRFAEVWVAALCVTVLLRVTESLFVIYIKKFATLNAVYGTFGGIMALLLWIYISGCIFIFGACLCAAQAEGRSATNRER
jgi:Ca2+-transporting ATPase